MREAKPNRAGAFRLIAREIVERKKRNDRILPKDVAAQLGVSHLTFLRWLESDEYHIHAEKLAHLCAILGDFTLLDHLEEQAGRVAFPIPDIKASLAADDLMAVQRLVKEVGEALQSLADTLEDHIVEDAEVLRTTPRLDDVIRECVRLKYWLKERNRADKQKAQSSKLRAV